MKCLVVLPTYNELRNLTRMIPAILDVDSRFDVLVVDDNSPDGSGRWAELYARQCPRVSALIRPQKLGLGTAYVAGFRQALAQRYDFVFEMDADFSHDPKDLLRLLGACQHADVAIGSRWIAGGGTRNWSALRQLISRSGSLYARLLLGLPIADLTSGFKCFRSDVLASLDLDGVASNGYAFQVELNYLCHQLGHELVEVPIVFLDREVGQSKMHGGIVLEAMLVVLRLRVSNWFGRLAQVGRVWRRQIAREKP